MKGLHKEHIEFQFGSLLKEFTRTNQYIRDNLKKQWLFKYIFESATIEVDLNLFNDNYKKKFIEPDLNRYCVGLLNKLQYEIYPVMVYNKVKSYSVNYIFQHNVTSHKLTIKYELQQGFV